MHKCFKFWNYNHVAKYCKKEEVSVNTAQKATMERNKAEIKTCMKRNGMEMIKRYNNNSIKIEHESMDKLYPTYLRRLEEEWERFIARRLKNINSEAVWNRVREMEKGRDSR